MFGCCSLSFYYVSVGSDNWPKFDVVGPHSRRAKTMSQFGVSLKTITDTPRCPDFTQISNLVSEIDIGDLEVLLTFGLIKNAVRKPVRRRVKAPIEEAWL